MPPFVVRRKSLAYAPLYIAITEKPVGAKVLTGFGLSFHILESIVTLLAGAFVNGLTHQIHPMCAWMVVISKLPGRWIIGSRAAITSFRAPVCLKFASCKY